MGSEPLLLRALLNVLRTLRRNWAATYFIAALLFFAFFFGYWAKLTDAYPARLIDQAYDAARAWRNELRSWQAGFPLKQTNEARYEGSGVTKYDKAGAQDGVTFLTEFNGTPERVRLLDLDGTVIHTWRAVYEEVFPDDELPPSPRWQDGKPFTNGHINLQGAKLYPNGDVVINFATWGIARLDRCSNVVWQKRGRYHHSISTDDDGNLWVSASLKLPPDLEHPEISGSHLSDFAAELSASGETLRELSVVNAVYGAGRQAILLATGKDGHRVDGDFLHLNDVEVLPRSMAAAFPNLDAGDIMVSIRNMNALYFFSPDGRLKSTLTGPFIRQHDPDFLPNGRILVFDNRWMPAGSEEIYSRILEVDPVSGAYDVVYAGGPDRPFLSRIMGTAQRLDNGNTLIDEATAGRAIEVTPKGEIVWEYINRLSDKYVGLLTHATRYPRSYAEFARTPCP